MKLLKKNFKKGEVAVLIEDIDDLWYLSQVVEPGDNIKGKTSRKIKLQDKNQQNQRVYKKKVFLKIKTDKTEFHEYSNFLRISGVVVAGPEDVPIGSHHTFNIEVGTQISIIKDCWFSYQIKRIEDATKKKHKDILICVLDREKAFFALLKHQGYKILSELHGSVAKKTDADVKVSDYYGKIISNLREYKQRYKLTSIIVASPAFWKEELIKQIKDPELKKSITPATCNTAEEVAILELMKRTELQQVLKQDRIAKEVKLVEELLSLISKADQAVYGFKDTLNAAQSGAISKLLLSTDFIHSSRQSENFSSVSNLMKLVEECKGAIHIINSSNEAGSKLDGLGGVGAVLRYKIN
jgi:protein pelota